MRVGVNIPNELLERFKPLKGTHNLSQICRDAILSYVETHERAVKQVESDDLQTIVNRLSAEYLKKTPLLDWEAIGRDDAKVWARLATLDDLEGFFYNLKIHKRTGNPHEPGPYLFPRLISEAPRFENHMQERDKWFERQIELDESVDPYTEAKKDYTRGWLSYLTAVWQLVKERIAADRAVMEKKFNEARERDLKGGIIQAENIAKTKPE
jgi:hypothetical protein